MEKGNCGGKIATTLCTISSFKLSSVSVIAWAISGNARTLMILVRMEATG